MLAISFALVFLAATTHAAPAQSDKYVCPADYVGLMADPVNCGAYYDCGNGEQAFLYYNHKLEAGRFECHYPLLFNEETKQCDIYDQVTCGQRTLYLDPCDLRQNDCADCKESCQYRFPTCVGLSDGLHAWRTRPTGFVSCVNERAYYYQDCPLWNGVPVMYDADSNMCMKPEN